MIQSAKVMHYVRQAAKYGVNTSAPQVDMAAVVARKDNLITKRRNGHYAAVNKDPNLTLFEGTAAFEAPNMVRVADELLEADKIVIATGARPLIPPVAGLNTVDYLTSSTILNLKELPESIIIMGGGPIAIEFAQMFARFGSKVTIIELAPRILAAVEPELALEAHRILEQENITIITGAAVISVAASATGVTVVLSGGDRQQLAAARLLVAVGRIPNTDMLQLDRAGVKSDPRGFVVTDDAMRTNMSGIWALGDVAGGPQFTHRAWHDGFLLGRHWFNGEQISTRNRLMPYAIFIDPEIASVGQGEQAARDAGHNVQALQFPFAWVGRAQAIDEMDGFCKLVIDANDRRVLGAHIIGPVAGEIVHELIAAIRFGATVYDLQDMIHIHPTMAEVINSTALQLP
jgi:pyruvate/2-oxoglutarate dehydrogenase complex dihydrolipoamide dehydrogenase (E3) component